MTHKSDYEAGKALKVPFSLLKRHCIVCPKLSTGCSSVYSTVCFSHPPADKYWILQRFPHRRGPDQILRIHGGACLPQGPRNQGLPYGAFITNPSPRSPTSGYKASRSCVGRHSPISAPTAPLLRRERRVPAGWLWDRPRPPPRVLRTRPPRSLQSRSRTHPHNTPRPAAGLLGSLKQRTNDNHAPLVTTVIMRPGSPAFSLRSVFRLY